MEEKIKCRTRGPALINVDKLVQELNLCFFNLLITINGAVTKFFLDAEKLVVFCHTV